jgi:hypothetical protein
MGAECENPQKTHTAKKRRFFSQKTKKASFFRAGVFNTTNIFVVEK